MKMIQWKVNYPTEQQHSTVNNIEPSNNNRQNNQQNSNNQRNNTILSPTPLIQNTKRINPIITTIKNPTTKQKIITPSLQQSNEEEQQDDEMAAAMEIASKRLTKKQL